MLGLIGEGLVPYLFVEGGYNSRLDIITDPDIPAASTYLVVRQDGHAGSQEDASAAGHASRVTCPTRCCTRARVSKSLTTSNS